MKLRSLLFFIFVTLYFTSEIFGGPTIIRDSRISDLALTPTLGRGYTIVTNTFQSKCLDNVQITDPSYDFQYTFESLETSNAMHLQTMANFGLAVPIKAVSVSGGASVSTSVSSTTTSHHIRVEINMDTYYASVDEARTRLGSSASQLLTNNDIPGFFSSCGSYYVRSLGRNAKFISIYTYTTSSTQRDVSFEAQLKASIMSFGGGCDTGEDQCSGPAPSGEAGVSVGASMSLMQKSDEYNLSIVTRAYGLGKNESASLISYDIETFKQAIKEAFISMQNPMTGKVTTMEIVPWVENTEFQNLIQLEKEVVDPITGKTMLLYKKKQVLNENAEYLAEIERADRNMMNIYYKSKICRNIIDANWIKSDDTVHDDYAESKIANNRFPKESLKLQDFINTHLKNEQITKLLDAETEFMYGSNGANICITKLLESGMFVKSYRNITECVNLRSKLSAVMNNIVDEYCMPQLVKEFVIQPTDATSDTQN